MSEDGFTYNDVVGMLFLDVLLYAALAWYAGHVSDNKTDALLASMNLQSSEFGGGIRASYQFSVRPITSAYACARWGLFFFVQRDLLPLLNYLCQKRD